MGLRGPGAKAIKKPADPLIETTSAPHPWEVAGLTKAERVIAFMESLPVTSGALAGTTFRVRPWQRRFLKAVYATDRRNRRQVRTAVLSMARKNGKTDVAARLALCHIAGPEAEERGEVYSAANDRFQAGRIFSEICAIIERVPWLDARISIRRHSKELEDIGGTGTVFAALSADVATKHGLSPSMWIYDELGQSPSRDLYDTLDTAMGARAEPLSVIISTQAARDEAPMSELVDYGLRVNAGEVKDPSFHLTLYTAPLDADPWERSTWKLANPALADFRSLEDVQRLASQAQRMPSREASFRNLILNQRVDVTQQFLTAPVWKACGASVDLDSLKGRTCHAALDLAASRDLTALVLVFEDDDGGFDVVPFFWLPGDDLRDREDSDRVPYVRWRDEGYLLTMPGKTTDPAVVARKIAELHGQFSFTALAYDRWRIEDLRRELGAIGADVPLVEWGQGFKDMSPAIDVLERLAVEAKLRHGMHPLLTWCAGNAKTTADPAGNRKLDKKKSTGRIDGIQSLAMALGAANRHEAQEDWSPMVDLI
ncbi:terminase large subunit [Methylobacterium sp. J-078]|uniref:terminase large subunit n=1 Tax=Methylobacterium sp. J-078 TaxID=2836657 RepID=UPI001FB8B0BB|nr:terminase TerL endonuclease subunit [Methylobacterium sp. J-078]MCJ2044738.1 terminase large subunit [Methylobacterium sp. J-078]